jgi:putative ABC transport system permease protein
MILTLVGVSRGVMGDIAQRTKGTGADIVIRPPGSTVFSFSGNMKSGQKHVALVREQPHVAIATGTLVINLGNFENITGIHPAEFDAMSGGFHYYEGGPFQSPDDIMVDEVTARTKNLHVGSAYAAGRRWRVCAVVQSGMLSHMFTEIEPLQETNSATDEINVIYVKVDKPENIPSVLEELKAKLVDYQIYSMEEFISLVSVNNFPLIRNFTNVVMGIAVIVGFFVVLLTMYTAVLERTREIGILKALGASPGYILGILLRESFLLAVAGTIAGILMTFGTQWLMHQFVPTMTQATVPDWWPKAGLITLVGALLGAIYPGVKAARQDAIEALSYD